VATKAETQTWARVGPAFARSLKAEDKPKIKEYISATRKMGGSLYLVIPAQVRVALGLYQGAPVRMLLGDKWLRVSRLETITAQQLDLLQARQPRSRQPWRKKLKPFGRQEASEQYQLR